MLCTDAVLLRRDCFLLNPSLNTAGRSSLRRGSTASCQPSCQSVARAARPSLASVPHDVIVVFGRVLANPLRVCRNLRAALAEVLVEQHAANRNARALCTKADMTRSSSWLLSPSCIGLGEVSWQLTVPCLSASSTAARWCSSTTLTLATTILTTRGCRR